MAFPANFTRVTVTGTYVDLEGSPLSGKITFTPSPPALLNPDVPVTIKAIVLSANLDNAGSFSLALPATDDPDIAPVKWTYRVVDPAGQQYDLEVPAGSPGGTFDVTRKAPAAGANPGSATGINRAIAINIFLGG